MKKLKSIFTLTLLIAAFAGHLLAQEEPVSPAETATEEPAAPAEAAAATTEKGAPAPTSAAVPAELQEKVTGLETTIKSLQEQIVALAALSAQADEMEKMVEQKSKQAAFFADFLQSANTSVNAMLLSSNLTSYLNDVSALNNPTNQDLGFSLADQVEQLLETNIFKGRGKIGGQEKGRFLSFVKNMINNPITTAVTGMFPVVGSITSVTNMVTGAAFADKDVAVEDVTKFNTDLKVYIQHYEGLAGALYQFNVANITTKAKLEQLQSQLRSIALDRLEVLYEEEKLAGADLESMELAEIIDKYYNASKVEELLEATVKSHGEEDATNFQAALDDKRFRFHEYEVSRASRMADQISALSVEIMDALRNYQTGIEAVLNHSKETEIGDPAKIDARIEQMRKSLEDVEKSFQNAVHVQDVHNKFHRMVNQV